MTRRVRSRVSCSLLVLALAATSAGAYEIRQISLPTNDLIFDPVSGRIYASVPGTAGPIGNSIVPINPADGSTGTAVFVGSSPSALAVAGDGSALYVSLVGAFAVRRVLLPAITPDLQFGLGSDPFFGPYLAEDIEVQPGSPAVIAVARYNSGISPRHAGVAIYDEGVQRPNATQRHTGANRIEFSEDPGLLYGYNNETTEFGFRHIAVDASGADETSVASGLISGFGVEIEFHAGRLYATTGAVLDPLYSAVVGTYEGVFFARDVVADSEVGEVYFLTGNSIQIFDLTSFTIVDTVPISGILGTPSSLVRWGERRLAFRTDRSQVFFIDAHPPDADGDGVGDAGDNCPEVSNADQSDLDADGLGDVCDPFPENPDNELAQCLEDLDVCQQTGGFADADGDGEHDLTDRCPATRAGEPVDDSGCSIGQFCLAASASPGLCNALDFRNDEPKVNPLDCRWLYGGPGQVHCVPRSRESNVANPEPRGRQQ